MIHITLPDGSIRSYDNIVTVMDVAKDISEGFARNVISAKFNDEIIETSSPLTFDGSLVLFTWKDQQGKQAFWHSSSHVLAQALEELYPGVKLWVGPAIDNGFYYDFSRKEPFTEDDLKKIEKKMAEIVDRDEKTHREVWKRDDAVKHFLKIGEKYNERFAEKVEV